jgi:pantoate--beta-alanine ligase
MQVISSVQDMQRLADSIRRSGKRIGVVPTMGYLHDGHLSLIRIARQHSDTVVTTIFVNPTQFAPDEDFKRYPRDLQRDLGLCESVGTDVVFAPDVASIYPNGYKTFIDVEKVTRMLEGKSRPSHFRGVATIVAKLFNIVKPHVAVFGQKDAQQAVVIKQMAKDLDFDVEIIIGPTVREPDGLAMSSRNAYLSSEERGDAVVLSESLRAAGELILSGEPDCGRIIKAMHSLIKAKPTVKIDYISVADALTLEELHELRKGDRVLISLAVWFGRTRLIDNSILAIQ